MFLLYLNVYFKGILDIRRRVEVKDLFGIFFFYVDGEDFGEEDRLMIYEMK